MATPKQIFHRAAQEGERRLDQSLLELASTSFIAGFTIVFGIVALGIIHALVDDQSTALAKIAGAFGLGTGLVFLVAGRSELFSENFFDPAATVADRRDAGLLPRLARLWGITFVFNLVGGLLFAWIMSLHGVLPEGTGQALSKVADEIAHVGVLAGFIKAVVGGALVALLSFMLLAVDSAGSRIALAFLVGTLLALGPFSHVIVTVLHVFFGMLFDSNIGLTKLFEIMLIATAGNLVGGIGLTTLTHVAQAKGARE